MRKGKFPPQATFYRGHFAPTWCFVIVPFFSSEFVFLLSFGEKSPTFPPQWKFEQLVKHELSPDSFSTRGTRKSYLIKIEFSTFSLPPFLKEEKLSTRAETGKNLPKLSNIFLFGSRRKKRDSKNIVVPRTSEFAYSKTWRMSMPNIPLNQRIYIARWRREEGRRIYRWKRIGASILCSNFARTESGSVCTLPSPPPSPQPNFSGLPALITSIPYRIACHWQNG